MPPLARSRFLWLALFLLVGTSVIYRGYCYFLRVEAGRVIHLLAEARPGQTTMDPRELASSGGWKTTCRGSECIVEKTLTNSALARFGMASPLYLKAILVFDGKALEYTDLTIGSGTSATLWVRDFDCYACPALDVPYRLTSNGQLLHIDLSPSATEKQRRDAYMIDTGILTTRKQIRLGDLNSAWMKQ